MCMLVVDEMKQKPTTPLTAPTMAPTPKLRQMVQTKPYDQTFSIIKDDMLETQNIKFSDDHSKSLLVLNARSCSVSFRSDGRLVVPASKGFRVLTMDIDRHPQMTTMKYPESYFVEPFRHYNPKHKKRALVQGARVIGSDMMNERLEGYPAMNEQLTDVLIDRNQQIAQQCLIEHGAQCSEQVRLSLKNSESIWRLVKALWGKLPDNLPVSLIRRHNLSEWLAREVSETVEQHLAQITSSFGNRSEASAYATIFTLLSGNQREKAAYEAALMGKNDLALLLSQSLQSQHKDLLDEIQRALSNDKLLTDVCSLFSNSSIRTEFEKKLDWKRKLGMHLWYRTSPYESIEQAFMSFLNSEPYPSNSFLQTETNGTRREKDIDIKFSLIQYYCCSNETMDNIVDFPLIDQFTSPAAYSADPLDYHLAWHLCAVLSNVESSKLSLYSPELSAKYAAQLERNGLWELAVHVMEYCTEEGVLKSSPSVLTALISRNIERVNYVRFLEQINIEESINEARAWYSRYKGNISQSVNDLIRAGKYNEAHDALIETAPRAILNDNGQSVYDQLLQLKDKRVVNWSAAGGVYYDFISITSDYQLLQISIQNRAPDIQSSVQKLLDNVEKLMDALVTHNEWLPKVVTEENKWLLECALYMSGKVVQLSIELSELYKIMLNEERPIDHSLVNYLPLSASDRVNLLQLQVAQSMLE